MELFICIVLYVLLFLRVLFVLAFSRGWGPILDWAVVTIPTIVGFIAWVIPVKETRAQHKWMLFVGGLIFSGLIYLQQYVTRIAHSEELANLPTKGDIAKLPNAKQIAAEVKKEMAENVIPEVRTPTGKPASHQSAEVKKTETKATEPAPGEVTHSPANQTKLAISQQPDISSREDAPYKTKVVVQATVDFSSLKMIVQCDKPLVDGSAGLSSGGVTIMTSQGVVKDHTNLFFFTYQSAAPQFGPANPIVFNLWSKEPIKCDQVATF
jgi:hypothetical protein